MTELDHMNSTELRRLAIINLTDLSYATGLLDGLGHTNTYLAEQWSSLFNIVVDERKVNTDA